MILDWVSVRLAEYPLVPLAVAWVVTLACARTRPPSAPGVSRAASRAGAAALCAYVVLAIWYLALGTYADHAEPTIPATAWTFWKGAPLYHAADAGPRYSLIYGPILYELHAVVLALLGPSIVSSKVLGVAGALGALALTWVALHGRAGRRERLVLIGALAVAMLAFRNTSFWTRAEPLLMLSGAAALLVAVRLHGWPRALLLGMLAGLSFGLKATGPVYLLPAVAIALIEGRPVEIIAAGLLGAAVIGAAYAVPGVSAANHWYWFRLAAANGLRRVVLVQNLQYAFLFAVPVAAGAVATGRARPRREHVVQVSTMVALGLVAVAASKPGGGAYHLGPLLPAVAFAAAPALQPGVARVVRMALLAVIAALLVVAMAQQVYYFRRVVAANRERADLDVVQFLAAHPSSSAAVGYGGAYRWSFVRPVPVFAGRSPYLLDAAALMEIDLGGVRPPRATIALVETCTVDYWLIPSGGRPFSLASAYTGREVFPDAFREAFERRYRKIGATRLFDVWQCSRERGDTP